MVFIIDKSLVNQVIAGNDHAKACFFDLLTAVRDGIHLIRMDVEDVQTLLSQIRLEDLWERILNNYMQQAYQLVSPLPGIIEGRLIYWREKESSEEDIDRLRQGVPLSDMDLSLYPDFKFYFPVQLWGEGSDDCAFFRKIGDAYKDKKNNPVGIHFKSNPGGGGTVGTYVKDASEGKQDMHLALCDSDKHHDDGESGVNDYLNPREEEKRFLGETALNLLGVYTQMDSLLVRIYIYKYTSELENLIPWTIVSQIHNDVFSNEKYENFDKSFFDIKKGMKVKELKESPELLAYWFPIFQSDEKLKSEVEKIFERYDNLKNVYETETNITRKKSAEQKFKNYQNTEILKGKRILKAIRNSQDKFDSLGNKEIYDLLTPNQKSEWDNIGALVLTFGAAGTPYLN